MSDSLRPYGPQDLLRVPLRSAQTAGGGGFLSQGVYCPHPPHPGLWSQAQKAETGSARAVCGCVWPCVACVAVCGRVWLCVIVCGRVWLCVAVCVPV